MDRIHLASEKYSCCEHVDEHVEVLTMSALCRWVSRAVRVEQPLGRSYGLLDPEDRGTVIRRNVLKYLPSDTA